MPSTFDELMFRLREREASFHVAGTVYANRLGMGDSPSDPSAAKDYKARGFFFLAAIWECEEFLLSSTRGEKAEEQLRHVRALEQEVMAVLNRLPPSRASAQGVAAPRDVPRPK